VRDDVIKIYIAGQKLDLVIVTHHDDDHNFPVRMKKKYPQ